MFIEANCYSFAKPPLMSKKRQGEICFPLGVNTHVWATLRQLDFLPCLSMLLQSNVRVCA
jgi:hypothetical protein